MNSSGPRAVKLGHVISCAGCEETIKHLDQTRHQTRTGATCKGIAVLAFPLPWTQPPLTQNELRRRGHWSVEAAQKKQALHDAGWAIRSLRIDPITIPVQARLVWRIPNRRHRDPDGLAPTMKVVLDALVQQGVLPGDDWRHVPETSQRIEPPALGPAMWFELQPDIPRSPDQ